MGSKRLPGKMMFCLAGEPVLRLIIRRVKRARSLDAVVLATSIDRKNAVLEKVAVQEHIPVFRGSENNVFARFDACLRKYPAVLVVRVCADNPFVCPELIDNLVRDHRSKMADYSCISPEKGWPDGIGAEVVNASVFDQMRKNKLTPGEREHCLLYIRNHPEEYSINLPNPPMQLLRRKTIKLDLNTSADYRKLRLLVGKFGFKKLVSLRCIQIIRRYEKMYSRRR